MQMNCYKKKIDKQHQSKVQNVICYSQVTFCDQPLVFCLVGWFGRPDRKSVV